MITANLCPLPYRVMAVGYAVTVSTADLATLPLEIPSNALESFSSTYNQNRFIPYNNYQVDCTRSFSKIHLVHQSFVAIDSLPEHVVFGWQCLKSFIYTVHYSHSLCIKLVILLLYDIPYR